jgi:predicted amidohydrolase
MLTCYDLRFPEVSLILRQKGAELITYPSAFAVRTGMSHWGESGQLLHKDELATLLMRSFMKTRFSEPEP